MGTTTLGQSYQGLFCLYRGPLGYMGVNRWWVQRATVERTVYTPTVNDMDAVIVHWDRRLLVGEYKPFQSLRPNPSTNHFVGRHKWYNPVESWGTTGPDLSRLLQPPRVRQGWWPDTGPRCRKLETVREIGPWLSKGLRSGLMVEPERKEENKCPEERKSVGSDEWPKTEDSRTSCNPLPPVIRTSVCFGTKVQGRDNKQKIDTLTLLTKGRPEI